MPSPPKNPPPENPPQEILSELGAEEKEALKGGWMKKQEYFFIFLYTSWAQGGGRLVEACYAITVKLAFTGKNLGQLERFSWKQISCLLHKVTQ